VLVTTGLMPDRFKSRKAELNSPLTAGFMPGFLQGEALAALERAAAFRPPATHPPQPFK